MSIGPQPANEDAASAGPAGRSLELACNLTSASESNLRGELGRASPIESGVLGVFGRPIWFYLIAAALALTALEWFLYQRRWIS